MNPGRYVGVGARAADGFDFAERLEELNEELESLNLEADAIQATVADAVRSVLEAVARG